jgi:hypothetical protein
MIVLGVGTRRRPENLLRDCSYGAMSIPAATVTNETMGTTRRSPPRCSRTHPLAPSCGSSESASQEANRPVHSVDSGAIVCPEYRTSVLPVLRSRKRSLIGEVVITPGEKRGESHAVLRGELMAILDLAAGRRRSPRPEVITKELAGPRNQDLIVISAN